MTLIQSQREKANTLCTLHVSTSDLPYTIIVLTLSNNSAKKFSGKGLHYYRHFGNHELHQYEYNAYKHLIDIVKITSTTG